MWLWAALLPAALAASLLRARVDTREGRVRFMVALWAIARSRSSSSSRPSSTTTSFPRSRRSAILVAFFLDDLVAGRERLHPLFAALGIGIVLLVTRDLMWEPERWIEMFVFRYDRPWPTAEPWQVDPSDGVPRARPIAGASRSSIAGHCRWRRIGVALLGVAGLAICVWALQVYMPDAGTHWGMRDAVRTYYEQRTIYGQKLVYFGAAPGRRRLGERRRTRWTFETFIPDTLQVGQPMTIRVQLNKAERRADRSSTRWRMIGTVTRSAITTVDGHAAPGRAREDRRARRRAARPPKAQARRAPPVRVVDADRLDRVAALLARREVLVRRRDLSARLPEMKTAFNRVDNVDFNKYLDDRTRAPLGRRYFIVTESGRATSVRSLLPTARAKETFEVLDTTTNKFSLVAFELNRSRVASRQRQRCAARGSRRATSSPRRSTRRMRVRPAAPRPTVASMP